jgi:hypothetical protein
VEDNFISDTARYIGLGVGRFGVNGSDMLGATVTGNVIVRSGGNAYFQGQPALQIGNGGDGQNVGTVTDATVTDNTIINSVYDAINFSTSTSTTWPLIIAPAARDRHLALSTTRHPPATRQHHRQLRDRAVRDVAFS